MLKVSVIIPLYNGEKYIQRCLDSVYDQDFNEYEIIVVNDGSTDGSVAILEKNQKTHPELSVVHQTNHGQGYARNRALEKARGDYILFLDADDYLEPTTLRDTARKIQEDKADVVHFGWRYSGPERPGASTYLSPTVAYNHDTKLVGAACDKLLSMTHFYSVNNLYRKSFLDAENIRYGEGYIYEDNLFMTLVANRASCISLLHTPYYVVHRSEVSSTRTGKDMRHANDFMRAAEACVTALKPRTEYSTFYLARYFQTKFIFYYVERVPFIGRGKYLRRFVDRMSMLGDIVIPADGEPERILRLCVKRGVYKQRKYSEFRAIIFVKTVLLPLRDALRRLVAKS